jgi:hypothetical protein
MYAVIEKKLDLGYLEHTNWNSRIEKRQFLESIFASTELERLKNSDFIIVYR